MEQDNESKSEPPVTALSPIVLGFTGHRNLPEETGALEQSLERVFEAFSDGRAEKSDNDPIFKLRKKLGFPTNWQDKGIPKGTPIWILSPMAEGADILAAVKASEFYMGKPHPLRFIASLAVPFSFRFDRYPISKDQVEGKPVGGAYRWDAPDGTTSNKNSIRETLRSIRGTFPPEEPTGDRYSEFVLPVGGRNILREHTCFPTDEFPEWIDKKEAEEAIKIQAASGSGSTPPPLTPISLGDASPDAVGKLLSTSERFDKHLQTGATYTSLYCHALIALWDGHLRINSVGTDAAVRINISGPDAKQLSHGPIFNWADSGPVVQIYTPNANPDASDVRHDDKPVEVEDGEVQEPSETEKLLGKCLVKRVLPDGSEIEPDIGEDTVLHPADCAMGDDPDSRSQHGKQVFRAVLGATAQFNRESAKIKEGDKYFDPIYAEESPFDCSEELDAKLSEVQVKGSVASQLAIKLKNSTMLAYAWLFLLVVAGAISFDLYAHYYAGISPGGHPDHHTWMLGTFLFIVAIAITVFITSLHKDHPEARYIEYRALAEGVRVQLVWLAAGIPQSVPLHYLQRHRGGFDWIRNTIAAWCFPYEDGQRRFDAIGDPNEKISRLKVLLVRWVRGQRDYFAEEAPRERWRHHMIHLMGTATAMVGIYAALFLISGDLPGDPLGEGGSPGVQVAAGIFFLIGIGLAIASLVLRFPKLEEHGHGESAHSHGSSRGLMLFCFWGSLVSFILAGWISGTLSPAHPDGKCAKEVKAFIVFLSAMLLVAFLVMRFMFSKKEVHEKLPFVPFLIAFLSFGVFGGGSILAHPGESHHLPAAHSEQSDPGISTHIDAAKDHQAKSAEYAEIPYVLLIGLPLLLGALMVAWGEKMLHSELANRYHAARELFRLTDRRLTETIERAETSHLLANSALVDADVKKCVKKIGFKPSTGPEVAALKSAIEASCLPSLAVDTCIEVDLSKLDEEEEKERAELESKREENDRRRIDFAHTLLLDEIQQLHAKHGTSSRKTITDPMIKKMIADLERETADRISEAQDILFELGKEALAENAEWLQVHRAFPLEFPMAG